MDAYGIQYPYHAIGLFIFLEDLILDQIFGKIDLI